MGKKHKTKSDTSPVVPAVTEPPAVPERRILFTIAIGLALALSVMFIVLFLYVSLSRIRYPFDLEWLEGSMVVNVQRVLAGQSP